MHTQGLYRANSAIFNQNENKENNPNIQGLMLGSQNNRAFGTEITNMHLLKTQSQNVKESQNSFQNLIKSQKQHFEDTNMQIQKTNGMEEEEQKPYNEFFIKLDSDITVKNESNNFDLDKLSEDEYYQKIFPLQILNGLEEIDLNNIKNPQQISVYSSQIFEFLKQKEQNEVQPANYMLQQTDINERMRAILIDWLIDVHLKFKLLPETLFMTISLIDRFLQRQIISRIKLQLLGVTAMLIACKFEEIYSPEVKDFVYVTDNAYTKQEILEMEGIVLQTLDFDLTRSSPLRFLERYAQLDQMDKKNFYLAQYLLEIQLLEYKMLKYSPSELACSALYLVNKIRQRTAWSEVLVKNTQQTEQDVRPCAKELCVLLQNIEKCSLQAVRKKFSTANYLQVSRLRIEKN